MSTEAHPQETTPAANAPFCVIATIRPGAVRRVREALAAIQPFRVTATEATIWGTGRELRYRGAGCHVDETAVRLEIACVSSQVDWIMGAIGRVLDADGPLRGSKGHVVAMPTRPASA